MRGIVGKALVASVAVAALATAVAVNAQTIPPPPDIPSPPDIPTGPDLGKPDDSAKFNVTIVGRQQALAKVNGSTFISPCNYELNVQNEEDWNFERGKGVTMVFERFGKIILMRRQGHPLGDTTLTVVGTVKRTATGGYNEAGPAPCRGAFPGNQNDCNELFPVKSPLALIFTRRGVLTVDRTAGQQLLPTDESENPARLCGSDDANPDTAYYQYSFPYMQKLDLDVRHDLNRLTKKPLFGNRKHLRLLGTEYDSTTVPGTFTSVTTTETDIEVVLTRRGKD